MCDNQFAWWLQNRQKVNNISDDALEFMKNDLIEHFGGIRSMIDKLFKHHTNLTINQHEKFFKFIDNKNKQYMKSLELNNDEIEVKNKEKLDESIPVILTLCHLNDQCLCNIFTFLSVTEHRNFQKCCINLNIVGTMRGSFISSQQMIQFGYIAHLTVNIKRLNNTNKDDMVFFEFIGRSLYTNDDILNERLLKQLCFSGYFESIIQSTMNNISAVMEYIYSISFNDELCWLLINNEDTLNVLKNLLDLNLFGMESINSGRATICVLESMQNIIKSHPSSISRLYKKGIPDILIKHIPKYSNERHWHYLHESLILLSFFIPFITEKTQQIESVINVIIEVIKILIVWIYDKKLLSSTILHKIPAVIGRILYSLYCNQSDIDFNPILPYISQLISSMKLDCFHTPDTVHYQDTLYELVLNLFRCKWDHFDIVEKYFQNVGFHEYAIMHNEPKRERIQPLIETVLESNVDEQIKRERLVKLYQVFKRDIYLVFPQNVNIALAFMPILMDSNETEYYWILQGISSIEHNYEQIAAVSKTLFSVEAVNWLKKIFELKQEEINRDNWMDRNRTGYAEIISIISIIYTNCNDNMVREKCHDLLLQIWSEDTFTYFHVDGRAMDLGNYDDMITFKNMVNRSIEFSKVVRNRFIMDNPWFVGRLLAIRSDQQRDDIENNNNRQEFVRYIEDIWRSVEALDETKNKIESKNYLINNQIVEQYTIRLGNLKLCNVDDQDIETLLRSLDDFLESYSLKQEDNAHCITLKQILELMLSGYHHSSLKEVTRNLLAKLT